MPPKQTDPQFKLRMTPEIKEAIEAAALQNNRSMNAEILARLQASIDGTGSTLNAPQSGYLTELREERARMERLLADYVFLFRTDVGNNLEKLREQVDQIQRERDTAKRIRPRGDTD
jgi:hypothetical protein